MAKTKSKKWRREYQNRWQAKYRKSLADQGLRQIRLVVHEEFVAEIRDIAARDIEMRQREIGGEK